MKSAFVPEQFREAINKAYKLGSEAIRIAHAEGAPEVEHPKVARHVEEHRWAWRPSIVKTVFIAESHVHTSAAEVELRIRPDQLPRESLALPSPFVRFVYCLGYGESGIVDFPDRLSFANTGTPHYWSMFGRLAGMSPLPTSSRDKQLSARINWKIDTLIKLRERGVWLLDASVHAIYCPGGIRRSDATCEVLHQSWWTHYGSPLLEWLSPRRVFVIGKGLAAILQRLGVDATGWIYQPHVKISPRLHEKQMEILLSSLD